MNLDIDHILFWMDAVRESNDRSRTLESFWKGQIKSKIWLIQNLIDIIEEKKLLNIVIHGGWTGILSSLLFQSSLKINSIMSIDIDPSCEIIANKMNKLEEMENRFQSITCNMVDFNYTNIPDLVINTSCEHITQNDYEKWLLKIPNKSLIVLQSNNFYDCKEHIRCAVNLQEFIDQSYIDVVYADLLSLEKYNRFMIIGKKIGVQNG